MSVEQGVDTEKFGEFVEELERRPDEARLELESTATYEGVVGRSLAKVGPFRVGGERVERETREYSYPYGAWREVEAAAGFVGPTDRIEPVETTLSALAACVNVAISTNALAQGIELDKLETTARTEVDPSVLFGVKPLEEAESCLPQVEIDIEVEGEDLSDEDLEQIEQMARRSPVHTLVSAPNRIAATVEKTG